MKKEIKIPTFIGLILLIVTIFAAVILSDRNINPLIKASTDCQPINPQVTNITNKSASISFTTNGSCLANIKINNLTLNDVRFGNNDSPNPSKIHYFDIFNLETSKEYSYELIVDGKTFERDSYNFKTASQPSGDPSSSNLAWGKVLNQDGTPASEGIVYLSIDGASPLSSFITSSGNWSLSLSNSFNDSLTDWFSLVDKTREDIIIIASDQSQTQVTNNTSNNNPVPDITIGQDTLLTGDSSEAEETGIIPTGTIGSIEKELDISNPKDEETISTLKPDFFGTGPAGSDLDIKVESPVVYTDNITVGDDGTWNWSPPENLTPGEHTITITTEDKKTITRKFVVLAAEGEPSFSASESAKKTTPTPTKSPTAIPTKVPTLIPTNIPVTIIPTNVPGEVSGDKSKNEELPKTGNATPTLLLIVMAASSISLAFYYRKK